MKQEENPHKKKSTNICVVNSCKPKMSVANLTRSEEKQLQTGQCIHFQSKEAKYPFKAIFRSVVMKIKSLIRKLCLIGTMLEENIIFGLNIEDQVFHLNGIGIVIWNRKNRKNKLSTTLCIKIQESSPIISQSKSERTHSTKIFRLVCFKSSIVFLRILSNSIIRNTVRKTPCPDDKNSSGASWFILLCINIPYAKSCRFISKFE